MCRWNAVWFRVAAVVLLVVGLTVVPSVSAFADGDSSQGRNEATGQEAGLLAEAIDWLVGLLTGSSTTGSRRSAVA